MIRKIATIAALALGWAVAGIADAQCQAGQICNPVAAPDLQTFFLQVINVIIVAGTYVLVLMIIYTGFLFVTAQGNEAKVTQARKSLLYTVIGGGILLGSWIIATAVANTVAAL